MRWTLIFQQVFCSKWARLVMGYFIQLRWNQHNDRKDCERASSIPNCLPSLSTILILYEFKLFRVFSLLLYIILYCLSLQYFDMSCRLRLLVHCIFVLYIFILPSLLSNGKHDQRASALLLWFPWRPGVWPYKWTIILLDIITSREL